jgi:hypothetical protein
MSALLGYGLPVLKVVAACAIKGKVSDKAITLLICMMLSSRFKKMSV